jgi:MFS family permease
LLVLALTGSGIQMGVVGAIQTLPDLLLGLPAGALADRWDRRRMMLYADVGRALLTALIPISFWLGLETMIVILLVTFPIGALRVLFAAAYTGAIPSLVERADLGRANGYVGATFSLGFIVGPALAGVLTATIGPAPTLAIDAASFLVSAGSLSLVRRSLRAEGKRADAHLLAEMWEGIRFVAAHDVLRIAVGFWGVLSIATAALIPAMTFYASVDRGFGAPVLGVAISAYAIGSLGGALLASRLGRERVGLRMVLAQLVAGATLLVLASMSSVPVFYAAAFAAGVSNSVSLVSYNTLRAAMTPDHLQGRVGSTARTIAIGAQPLGMVAGGTLIDLTSGATALAAMGGLGIGASLVFGLSRRFRTAGH